MPRSGISRGSAPTHVGDPRCADERPRLPRPAGLQLLHRRRSAAWRHHRVVPGDVPRSSSADPGAEPASTRPLDAWLAQLSEKLAAYRQVTGTPLDALMLDLNWDLPGWESRIRPALTSFTERHRAGLFLNARGGRDVTDQSWMDAARQHAEAIAANRFALDYVIVASWQRHPARLLPDNDPLALTSLLATTTSAS